MLTVFFRNQAALEGFLQFGLRNRIGLVGGTGSPRPRFGGSPRVFECSPMNMQTFSFFVVFVFPQPSCAWGVLTGRIKKSYRVAQGNWLQWGARAPRERAGGEHRDKTYSREQKVLAVWKYQFVAELLRYLAVSTCVDPVLIPCWSPSGPLVIP